MSKEMKRNRIAILLFSVFFVLTNWSVFAKDPVPELVKQEEGYYYGYGKGATAAEAQLAAKRDLIENALAAELKAANVKSYKLELSNEAVKARKNRRQLPIG